LAVGRAASALFAGLSDGLCARRADSILGLADTALAIGTSPVRRSRDSEVARLPFKVVRNLRHRNCQIPPSAP
jgi:hypothetical protein